MQYYEQTRNLITRAKEFTEYLSHLAAEMEKSSRQEKVHKIATYFHYHLQELNQTLNLFGHETANKLLDTWFKYIPEGSACKCFDIIHVYSGMSCEEVSEILMEIDGCLFELYEEIARMWETQEIREAFWALLSKVKKEKSKLASPSVLLEY